MESNHHGLFIRYAFLVSFLPLAANKAEKNRISEYKENTTKGCR